MTQDEQKKLVAQAALKHVEEDSIVGVGSGSTVNFFIDELAKLKGRMLTVTPGWSESYGLFTKGEAPMVLSYTTSPAYHMIAEGTEKYQAAAFESMVWFENAREYMHLSPMELAYTLMTRSGRVSYEDLKRRDPAFIRQYELASAVAPGAAGPHQQ